MNVTISIWCLQHFTKSWDRGNKSLGKLKSLQNFIRLMNRYVFGLSRSGVWEVLVKKCIKKKKKMYKLKSISHLVKNPDQEQHSLFSYPKSLFPHRGCVGEIHTVCTASVWPLGNLECWSNTPSGYSKGVTGLSASGNIDGNKFKCELLIAL